MGALSTACLPPENPVSYDDTTKINRRRIMKVEAKKTCKMFHSRKQKILSIKERNIWQNTKENMACSRRAYRDFNEEIPRKAEGTSPQATCIFSKD